MHDPPVRQAAVLVGERGDRRGQRHPAFGRDRQDVQERILLRRRPPGQDHPRSHRRDEDEDHRPTHDEQHGQNRAGHARSPSQSKTAAKATSVHQVAQPPGLRARRPLELSRVEFQRRIRPPATDLAARGLRPVGPLRSGGFLCWILVGTGSLRKGELNPTVV